MATVGPAWEPAGDAPTASPASDAAPVLSATGVRKVYGATVALDDGRLSVAPGEIHALLGENGAGKSTFVRILAGLEPLDGGEISIFGSDVLDDGFVSVPDGCAFIHQDLGLFPTLSVAENIGLGSGFARRFGLISGSRTAAAARELLDGLGLDADVKEPVADLPLADQTAVAIGRALVGGARLIVLDEPTAYLEAKQVKTIFDLLSKLREQGVACILITHRAEDVIEHCDNLTVLRNGVTVASRPTAGVTESELVRLISPDARLVTRDEAKAAHAEPAVQLRGAAAGAFGPLDLEIGAGEIVGICGLADAGYADVGRALFGLLPLEEGELEIRGAETPGSPREAIAAGIAYVPADRRAAGLAERMTARENIFMRPRVPWFRPLRAGRERAAARTAMERFHVHPSEPEYEINAFSGGNQQKILLAKWLRNEPMLLILHEPTAGVDLGAKAELHALVTESARSEGIAVLLMSSDFTEVSQVCDRVYVMRHGRIQREVPGDEVSAGQLIALAYGEETL